MESVWKNSYTRKTSLIHVGKKTKHASDLITAVGFLGPCTSREAAKFVLSRSKGYSFKPVRNKDSSVLERIYRKRIVGEKEKKTGDKVIRRKSIGLSKHEYLFVYEVIVNEKDHYVDKYFLSLRGCFFVLGNTMNDDDLISFIKNASKNYLFFKYLYKILEDTSIELVRKLFLKPIHDLIKKDMINLDENFELTFALIAEKIGYSVYAQHGMHYDEYGNMMRNNWYDGSGNRDWLRKMIAYYYEYGNERDEFWRSSDMINDPKLLFKVMYAVHSAFYSLFDYPTPVKHVQRLPKLVFSKFAYPKGKTWINAAELWDYRKRKRNIMKL